MFLCFSFLVVGLLPQCGCEYLLLGVDVVCHCFCSPCCDLCAAAWVTVLCTVFEGVIFLVSLLLLICAALLEGNVSLLFQISVCSVRCVCRLSGSRVWFLCKFKIFQGWRSFFPFSHSELCSLFRPLGRRSFLR